MPNVLVSPHSASTVAAENRLITDLFIDNLRRWLAGEPLRNVFDSCRGLLTPAGHGRPRPPRRPTIRPAAGPDRWPPRTRTKRMADKLRVAVVGTGSWAQRAHIPGWQRDRRAEVVALADIDPAARPRRPAVRHRRTTRRTTASCSTTRGSTWSTSSPATSRISRSPGMRWGPASTCCARSRCTPSYRKTHEAAELARSKGLKTKLGFTFRYAPAIQYAKELIDSGFVGEPVHLQRLRAEQPVDRPGDAAAPGGPVRPTRTRIAVSSIEGYGAPIIDIMHWWLDAPLAVRRRHHAQFRPDPDGPRYRPDAPGEHRRR